MPCILLYPHNRTALERLTAVLEEAPGAAVIQPTGTGKSFVALAFIEGHPDARFLYLSPSTHIFTQLRHHAKGSNILRHTGIVALYLLSDDAPLRCAHFYCSAAGDADRTEVYVVPTDQLPTWMCAAKRGALEGVMLLETHP